MCPSEASILAKCVDQSALKGFILQLKGVQVFIVVIDQKLFPSCDSFKSDFKLLSHGRVSLKGDLFALFPVIQDRAIVGTILFTIMLETPPLTVWVNKRRVFLQSTMATSKRLTYTSLLTIG